MLRGFGIFTVVALAGGLHFGSAVITSQEAHAAQVYVCTCDGERKRFFASSRYCEKKSGVKQCSTAQYRKIYSRACRERGCRLPEPR
jgi:hypothetical protein